jgi:fructose/tagatose bisphosphate aldolase
MTRVATSVADLLQSLRPALVVSRDGMVKIGDQHELQRSVAARLAWSAAFSEDEATVLAAQWLVRATAIAAGIQSASIAPLYAARAAGLYDGLTVPAINLRTQVFDMARVALEAATSVDGSALIFELARSEQTYTFQRPADFATSVMAGAIAAGWRGPLFLQGDHYQFVHKKYLADPAAVTAEIARACRLAVEAGYRNIDIDASTLVDLSQPTAATQQRVNAERTAEAVALVRELEPAGVEISMGGEIGEVGTSNSTVGELDAYLDEFGADLARRMPGATGLRKVSVQTGTSHGGVPLPGGGVATVALDFDVLRDLGARARERGLAGAVQHGASTLPPELFNRFPEVGTAEIHLATGFQNALYDHADFPVSLRGEITTWLKANAADEAKPGDTEEQFLYRTRKKALGPFKRAIWELPTVAAVLEAQRVTFDRLFRQLGVSGSREVVERFVPPLPDPLPPVPEALLAALRAEA